MKAFEFRLQKILELREFDEKQAKNALARAISDCEKLKNEKRKMLEEIDAVDRGGGAKTFSELQFRINLQTFLRKKISVLDVQIDAAQKIVVAMQKKMGEATKKRKILEKLREKQFAEYKKAAEREAEASIDDMIATKF